MNPKSMSSKSKKSKEPPHSGKATDAIKFTQPTTFELTQIAALLSGNSSSQDDSELAQRAFQLWEACNQQLLQRFILTQSKIRSFGIRGFAGIPESWPCSFDKALRLVMPKKRTLSDRYGLFRDFLKDKIPVQTQAKRYSTNGSDLQRKAPSEKKTLDEIEAVFKEFKQQGFKDLKEYQTRLTPFVTWLRHHKTETISAQRSIAAKAKWAKKKADAEIQAAKEKSRVS